MLGTLGTAVMAQDLPSYMAPIAGRTTSTPANTADENVLALNTGMFQLYDDAAKIFRKNFMSKHPVILGLFTGAGGRFILYRPGMAPLDAPSVPLEYQLMKSIGHSTMALTQMMAPYLDNPADQSWRGPMLAYRSRMKSALDGLNLTAITPEWRDTNRIILENNIAFMDDCLAKGSISFAALAPPEAGRRMGGPETGRALDGRARGLEGDARPRLGQDLCSQQHHLCRASEQRPVQHPGAVFRAGRHQ
jgi:hypothetical protein